MYGDAAKADVKMNYVYSFEEALKRAKEEKKLIFFNCFADWAVPCHQMNKAVFSDQKFCDYMDKHFVNLFMDMSTPEGKNFRDRYQIKFMAHYVVLDAEGNLVHRIVGGARLPEFQEKVACALSPETSLVGMNAAYDRAGSGYTGTDTVVTLSFYNQMFDSTSRGVQIYGDYIYWYGIDVCGAGDNGLFIGGDFNTVEYCEFYNNRDTGLQLGRAESSLTSITQWPSYNLVKNCTSHNNYDNETYGENADGFAAKLTVGYGNVFDGCIAYRNSDDGWDLYAKSDTGNIGCVIMYNCVAFENGYLEYTRDECNSLYPSYANFEGADKETTANPYGTANGDGNGFKLGGSVMEGDVYMYNCLSFQNRMHGVTDNSNPSYIKIDGITSYDNSAAIDMQGNVVSQKNSDDHGNIDLARQTYSYNTVNRVLSVHSAVPQSLANDAYRGSVTDSILNRPIQRTAAGSGTRSRSTRPTRQRCSKRCPWWPMPTELIPIT